MKTILIELEKLISETKKIQEMLRKIEDNKNPVKYDFHNIKNYEDACDIETPSEEDKIYPTDTFRIVCLKKLLHIIKIVNGSNFIPDWSNFNQRKYYPWFNLSSGFGFGGSDYYYDDTYTAVGSLLCFENEEKCNHIGEQPEILKLYEGFLK